MTRPSDALLYHIGSQRDGQPETAVTPKQRRDLCRSGHLVQVSWGGPRPMRLLLDEAGCQQIGVDVAEYSAWVNLRGPQPEALRERGAA